MVFQDVQFAPIQFSDETFCANSPGLIRPVIIHAFMLMKTICFILSLFRPTMEKDFAYISMSHTKSIPKWMFG